MDNLGLEQEIQQIQKQLEEKRELLAKGKESAPHDKEVLKEVIKEKISETPVYNQPMEVAPHTTPAPSTAHPPLYLTDELKQQVQDLVNLAFTKNIQTAINELKRLNNPALEDAFHDVLVDELYEELINRGIIKEVKN